MLSVSRVRSVLALCVLGLLSACATDPNDPFNDPYEDINREIFALNDSMDRNVLVPVAEAYRDTVPEPVRQSVTNGLRNLNTPLIFINEVLQGDMRGAEVAFNRFWINSFLGIGGLFDIAGMDPRLEYRSEDFGQTLAVWGVEPGPYLVLPLLGPSNPRDLAGLVGDQLMDPVRWVIQVETNWDAFGPSRFAATLVDRREAALDALEEVRASSLDYYAAIRSLYRQNREAEINDSDEVEPVDIPNYDVLEEDNG
ncbi:MAG: VacJ family lipoprotein [Rhodospirillaceae bacterium]|nr:VacJ family lipoprotein [Rhodospirillaceae bacterium]MCA8933043.1 VacJ family lipoprotein [Rhodospirillaceae bacterium]